MAPTDAELLARLTVDPQALEVFYRRHIEAVTRFVARRATQGVELADVVAETFVAAIESAGSYDRRRGTALPWLYGIARNKLAEGRRGASRSHELLERLGGRRELSDQELLLLEERIDAERTSPRLLAAIDRLGPDDRALLELVALEDLSLASAARAIGIAPANARMRMSRVRKRMRALMREDDDRHDPVSSGAPNHGRTS